jgi:hypothetical protein
VGNRGDEEGRRCAFGVEERTDVVGQDVRHALHGLVDDVIGLRAADEELQPARTNVFWLVALFLTPS